MVGADRVAAWSCANYPKLNVICYIATFVKNTKELLIIPVVLT